MSKISVLMPVYNGEKYLREAIDSILNQTETDFEFLIVDDGSTDNTENIVRSYPDPRILYFKRPHEGLIKTLNFGLAQAKGEYIAKIHSDDIAFPERLARQSSFLIQNDLVLCGSWAIKINDRGQEMGIMNYPPIGESSIRKYSLLHSPFIHPSVMFVRQEIIMAGGYRNYRYGVEDYELWTRIIYTKHVDNMPEPLIKYRLHSQQITRRMNLPMRFISFWVRMLAFYRFFLASVGLGVV